MANFTLTAHLLQEEAVCRSEGSTGKLESKKGCTGCENPDAAGIKEIWGALTLIGASDEEKHHLLQGLSAVLHLGEASDCREYIVFSVSALVAAKDSTPNHHASTALKNSEQTNSGRVPSIKCGKLLAKCVGERPQVLRTACEIEHSTLRISVLPCSDQVPRSSWQRGSSRFQPHRGIDSQNFPPLRSSMTSQGQASISRLTFTDW